MWSGLKEEGGKNSGRRQFGEALRAFPTSFCQADLAAHQMRAETVLERIFNLFSLKEFGMAYK